MKTIVVAYDGAAPADAALERAVTLATAVGAEIVVAVVGPHAQRPPGDELSAELEDPLLRGWAGVTPFTEVVAGAAGPGAEPEPGDGEGLHPRVPPPVTAALERARGLLATAGVSHRLLSGAGQPADEIVAIAREVGADLIVVGTHEPAFVDRLLHGSVSEDVSRNASCDVLIVRRPPAAGRRAR